MSTVVKWPEILSFHNLRSDILKYPQVLLNQPVVTYRGKVKLHGTNAGIQIHPDGQVIAQSRVQTLTPDNDNATFAAWVQTHKDAWGKLQTLGQKITVFGEWIGPGVAKHTTLTELPTKVLAVFAIIKQHLNSEVELQTQEFIQEPDDLQALISDIPETYILPWYQVEDHIYEFKIDWSCDADQLQSIVDNLNLQVHLVECCDPWVKSMFGIEGVGEGLVFYPISHQGREAFSNLAFKSKGEKHRVIKVKEPVQIDPTVVASIAEFVELVVTPARLYQGMQVLNQDDRIFDARNIGPFIGWICKDVEKETSTELTASKLTWKQVSKPVAAAARQWYLDNIKKQ